MRPSGEVTADGIRDHVAQSLVVALGVVVLDELSDDAAQMIFAERDDVPETLLLDRANEPFRVGVQIRAARRQPQERHARHAEKALHVRGVKRISVDDVSTSTLKKSAAAMAVLAPLRIRASWGTDEGHGDDSWVGWLSA